MTWPIRARQVRVVRDTPIGKTEKYPPGDLTATPDKAGAAQFQGAESQSFPRGNIKYARANIGHGTGEDIPPVLCPEAYTAAQRAKMGI